MPRLSPWLDVIAGVDADVSLNDGTLLAARGNLSCFLDPSRAIFHQQLDAAADRWALRLYDLATRQSTAAPGGERGASFLAARGGRWFAFLPGVGVYNAQGAEWPEAGLAGVGTDGRGAIGKDGTVGFVRNYQAGTGLQMIGPDGEVHDLPDAAIPSLSIYDISLAVWVEGGQIRAYGRPDPAPQREPVSHASVVKVGAEYLLLVTTNDRLWLRRWVRPVGKVVVPTPTAFAADAAPLGSDAVRVVWSPTAGERSVEHWDVPVAALEEAIVPIVIDPPIDPPPAEPSGTVTITSYEPSTLYAGGTVNAAARVTGDVVQVEWLRTEPDGKTWIVGAEPAKPTMAHVFQFPDPGTYVIGLRGRGANGQTLDQTGQTRIVTVRPVVVVDPPIDPPPDAVLAIAPPATGRTPFMVGVCWPNDLTGAGAPHDYGLRMIRLLGANCLRIGLSQLNPHWRDDLARVIAQDFWPLPIVDIVDMADFEHELAELEAYAEVLLRAAPWLPFLELANEPSGRFAIDDYVQFVERLTAVRDRVGSSTVLLTAAETHNFGTGQPHHFWRDVNAQLGTVEAAAIHPYRNPKPWAWSAFGSREAEWSAIQAASAQRLIVTETGWHDGEDQANNIVNELDLLRSFGCELVCIYAMVTKPADWGLFFDIDGAWVPGPAAAALAHYLQEKPL